MKNEVSEKFKNWLLCTDVRRFSRELRNMLLEYSAMNTKVVSDISETYIDLLGLFEVLDEAETSGQSGK